MLKATCDFLKGLFIEYNIPLWLYNLIYIIIIALIIIGFVLLTVLFLTWLERKLSARFQSRLGPMRVAWPRNLHGWAQPIADAIKLLIKEDIIAKSADRWVFTLAPLVVFVPAYLVYLAIPFAKGWIVKDLNIGILYIIAISSLGVIGIIMAGWGSNNKYSLLSALRSAAQMVSYEVPLILSIIVVVMLTGSLSMVKIVEVQKNLWFAFLFPVGPLAFLIYLISATAELNRIPFDLPEAEQELVAGFHIEYSGMKFAFFFLAEYANLFAISAICATLFLGGWQGPVLPPLVWFFLKSYLVVFILMWLRWTLPRVRVDQLMNLAWKVLLPLALINIALTGIVMMS